MRKRTLFWMMLVMMLVMLALLLGLVGCGWATEETPTPEFPVDEEATLSITGEAAPARRVVLSAPTGGTMIEILVTEGDEVEAEQTLARLDAVDAELAVQRAEAALASAQARLMMLQERPRPEIVARARQQVQATEAAIAQALAERNRLAKGIQVEVAEAEAELARAEAAYKQAQIDYDQKRGRDVEDWIEEEAAIRLRGAEHALKAAQLRLDRARRDVRAQIREADVAVTVAEAQKGVAQAQLELTQAGALAEEIAQAQAGVKQAQAMLEAARATLARYELHAPFDGTVGGVTAQVGETLAPGQPLLTLGDLRTLQVETTDLGEADVTRVGVGQEATITFDVLPERTFTAQVIHIAPMAEAGSGGVHYTAVLALDELAPEIRWGMTAFIELKMSE